ncbi:ATP-binding protein [Azohydromonas caseinilytica]|uniref:histidine kinase n=1 Tax=Azohydromonas caseinilytica TaxID=2728836 RepID=A0A848FDA4_9BURK|nr:ATP-binding protein [Azohydromonas caseinilytica]NML18187.1 two-component sensor histidine kinase [Azohydromonas caseinilytica]
MKTLRARLVAILALSLAALWSAVAVWMFLDVRQELRTALDERLAASARMVAGLVAQLPPERLRGGGADAAALDVIGRDGLACEVSLVRGEVWQLPQTIARTGSSPGLQAAAAGYSTQVFGGKLWRTYVLEVGGLRIATADRLDVRTRLLREVALSAAVPFAIALGGSLLLLWIGVGRGLRPLERMRRVLADRPADAHTPLPPIDAPAELRPLIGTVDHLLQRVQDTIARERRFTDDAAHELRTPLTAIKTHLQVLRLACRGRDLDETTAQALANAESGVARLQHTLDQLLLLARLDGQAATPEAAQADAQEAARLAIADASAAAPGRVTLEGAPLQASVPVPLPLLVCALRNLLDNALRHAPPGSAVVLRLAGMDTGVAFSVLDEGPGMTAQECEQAPRRFWRRNGGSTGSGLGLSIVESIARRHGGELQLMPRAAKGLEARLLLPAVQAA